MIEQVLDILGKKWTLLILSHLCKSKKRFGELLSELEGVSPKTLTLRLRSLEENGLVQRTVYPTIPPTVEYALTEKGADTRYIFFAMQSWGQKYLPDGTWKPKSRFP